MFITNFFVCRPTMRDQYPCAVFKLEVNDNDDSRNCGLCCRWNHTNCVEVSERVFGKLKKNTTSLDLCNSIFLNQQKRFEKSALLNKFSPTSINY